MVCKEEITQEQLKPMLSLLFVLMRSKSITGAFVVLYEIIKTKTYVVTKVENCLILTFCILYLIQTYLAISSQF